jgi:hypothetical protein
MHNWRKVNKQHIAITTCSIARFTRNKFKSNVIHSKSLSTCNFHKLPIPQGTSAYHISHSSLFTNFVQVHKWNFMHVCSCNIYFEPKVWNNCTMKLLYPPSTIHFARCHLLPCILWIHQCQRLSNNKLDPPNKQMCIYIGCNFNAPNHIYILVHSK